MKWKIEKHTIPFQSSFFSVHEDECIDVDQHRHTFYTIEASDWVSIFALTADDRLVCVDVYRYGTNTNEIEVPAGIVEKNDKTPLDAAKRELEEETGYTSLTWVSLGLVSPNPAFMKNRCHVFLAKDAIKTNKPNHEQSEKLETKLFKIQEFEKLIREGKITSAMTIAGFYLFHTHRE